MTLYRLRHETVYDYAEPVAVSHNEVHLRPRALAHQALHAFHLTVDPEPETLAWRRDYFGNDVAFVALRRPHRRLALATTSIVERRAGAPIDADASPPFEEMRGLLRANIDSDWRDALELALPSPFAPAAPELAGYARPSFAPGTRLAAGVLDLCARIHGDFRYDARATTLTTPVLDVLRARRGVCQDFAHLMIGCLRSLGLPARYVSGYLRTARTQGGAPALVGADASHAWVAAFCPANGWVEIDPTNDLVAGEQHLTLAWGRDYDDVSPVKGVTVGGGSQTMRVSVDVVAAPADGEAGSATFPA